MPVPLHFTNGFSIAIIVLALAGCGGGGGGNDAADPPSASADSSQPTEGTSEPSGTATSNPECAVTVKEGATIATYCNDFARFIPNVEFGHYRGITKPRDVTQEPRNCRVSLHPTEGIAITTYSSATFDEITSRHEVGLIAPDGTKTDRWPGLINHADGQAQTLQAIDIRRSLLGMFLLDLGPRGPDFDDTGAAITSIDEQNPFEVICTKLEKE